MKVHLICRLLFLVTVLSTAWAQQRWKNKGQFLRAKDCAFEGDFNGFDIEYANLGSRNQSGNCRTRCNNNPQCTHYTYSRASGVCTLKKGNGVASYKPGVDCGFVTQRPNQNITVINQGCYFGGGDNYDGRELERIAAPNEQTCENLCLGNPGCTNWTFRHHHRDCIMLTGRGHRSHHHDQHHGDKCGSIHFRHH